MAAECVSAGGVFDARVEGRGVDLGVWMERKGEDAEAESEG